MSRKTPRLAHELPHRATGVTLAREWLALHYPYATVLESAYLGAVPTVLRLEELSPAERRVVSTNRPRVQFLALTDGAVVLAEGCEKADGERVLRLAYLRGLVPATPELAAAARLPVRAVLCARYAPAQALELARRTGVELLVPAWSWTAPEANERPGVAADVAGEGAREHPSPGVAGSGKDPRTPRSRRSEKPTPPT